MLLIIVLVAIAVLINFVLTIVAVRCLRSYYCSKFRGWLLLTFGWILMLMGAFAFYRYYSIPSLEDTRNMLKLENFVESKEFEGKTIFIILPKELQNNPQKAEIIRNFLCAAIKDKLHLKDFYCKFYTRELDEALKLNLSCNFLNICRGWVIEKVYSQNGENVYKERLLGEVVFRLN